MPKRRLFSKADGTTFITDVKAISNDFKNFFNALPAKLKAWIYEAEVLVNAVQELDDAWQEGKPLDIAIDNILAGIKGDVDEKIYEAVKEALSRFLAWIENAQVIDVSVVKANAVSSSLNYLSDLPTNECNLLTELAVYGLKS